mmetsp:Transcript_1508/g.4760  ORF Transcript_1508/g.4760 Transcript_1508/m.4760 type:complete len:835 (-) Transcript_1508:141-2645(-)
MGHPRYGLREAVVVAIAALASAAVAAAVGDAAYDNVRELGDGVTLRWTVFEGDVEHGSDTGAGDGAEIHFQVSCPTTGWCAIGVSPNGGMTGSDIALGWVDDSGEVHMNDRMAVAEARPPIDEQDDLTDIEGAEADGVTTLAWTRPLRTCDDQDLEITMGATRVVYAFQSDDPQAPDFLPTKHDVRGAMSVPLVGSRAPPELNPDELVTFDALINNGDGVHIPAQGYIDAETSYMCSAFKLPEDMINTPLHLVHASPIIQEDNAKKVHHFLIYQCFSTLNQEDLSYSGHCYGSAMPANLRSCNGGTIIAAWAVGAGETHFPENVGFPMGAGGARYFLLETHYDNYDHEPFDDASGMRLTMTANKRTHDAGVMQLGHLVVSSSLRIPAGEEKYAIEGWCPAGCTNEYFPEEGITIFGLNLHSHVSGRALSLRHIRNGRELPPIGVDANYDFNMQTVHFLSTPRKVERLDTLLTTCVYDTTDRTETTFAGPATSQEMCLSFIWYYPAVPATNCESVNGRKMSFTDQITGFTSCRGNEYASCGVDGGFFIPEAEKSFRPLIEESCGELASTTTFKGVHRQPLCNDEGRPTPDGGQSAFVGSYCMHDMCDTQWDRCSANEACVAELDCVLEHCGGDTEECDACSLDAARPLQRCIQRFCGTNTDCLHCGGCGECFGNGDCAGNELEGACASCAHCEACEQCWVNVDGHKRTHQCLNRACEAAASACGAGCLTIVDCYTDCVHDATIASEAGSVAGSTYQTCLEQCVDEKEAADAAQLFTVAACGAEQACFPDLEQEDIAGAQATYGGANGAGRYGVDLAAALCAVAATFAASAAGLRH